MSISNIHKHFLEYTHTHIYVQTHTVDSCYFLCKAFLPLLKKGKNACVVNISSAAGLTSTGTGAIYAMTKVCMRAMCVCVCFFFMHSIHDIFFHLIKK
jgi:NADP-dependent 3-hydroxy acid dehydrogenase YdfG